MPPRFKDGKPLFKGGKPFLCLDECCPNPCPTITADFDWTVEEDGLTYNFTDESTTEEPYEIISWLWDFGDGNTSTEENPTHTYVDNPTAGDDVHTICLTVCIDFGDGTEPECCATVCKTPCVPPTEPFPSCNETVLECLENMGKFIQFDFGEVDGDYPGCNLPGQSGIYPLNPVGSSFLADLYEKFAGNGCGGLLIPCATTGYGPNLYITCSSGQLNISSIWAGQCLPGEGGWISWSAGASFPMPITVYSGIEFDLGAITSSTGMTGNIKIRFVGKPCEPYDPEEPPVCEDPPIVDFTWSSPTGDDSCYKELDISINSKCPIDYCYWSDGNAQGCDRPSVVVGYDDCGPASKDLTLYVVDKRGCIASVTKTLTCCSCDANGGQPCDGSYPAYSWDEIDYEYLGQDDGGDDCGNVSNFLVTTKWYFYPGEPNECGHSKVIWMELGPHPDGGMYYNGIVPSELTIGIKWGWFPHVCARLYQITVVDDSGYIEGDPLSLIGCDGPWVCDMIMLNSLCYPGNYNDVEMEVTPCFCEGDEE